MTERICEVFDLIRQYAEREGWIPIGWRRFTVGEWQVTVNGTNEERESIPPFHALVENTRYIGLMLFSPFGGTTAGYRETEKQFCDAMKAALVRPYPRRA